MVSSLFPTPFLCLPPTTVWPCLIPAFPQHTVHFPIRASGCQCQYSVLPIRIVRPAFSNVQHRMMPRETYPAIEAFHVPNGWNTGSTNSRFLPNIQCPRYLPSNTRCKDCLLTNTGDQTGKGSPAITISQGTNPTANLSWVAYLLR